MKFRDLTESDVGKWFVWPAQRPWPIPFIFHGLMKDGGEPAWLIEQRDLPPNSMLVSVWEDTEIERHE